MSPISCRFRLVLFWFAIYTVSLSLNRIQIWCKTSAATLSLNRISVAALSSQRLLLLISVYSTSQTRFISNLFTDCMVSGLTVASLHLLLFYFLFRLYSELAYCNCKSHHHIYFACRIWGGYWLKQSQFILDWGSYLCIILYCFWIWLFQVWLGSKWLLCGIAFDLQCCLSNLYSMVFCKSLPYEVE